MLGAGFGGALTLALRRHAGAQRQAAAQQRQLEQLQRLLSSSGAGLAAGQAGAAALSQRVASARAADRDDLIPLLEAAQAQGQQALGDVDAGLQVAIKEWWDQPAQGLAAFDGVTCGWRGLLLLPLRGRLSALFCTAPASEVLPGCPPSNKGTDPALSALASLPMWARHASSG